MTPIEQERHRRDDHHRHRRRYPQKATEAPYLKEAGTGEELPHLEKFA